MALNLGIMAVLIQETKSIGAKHKMLVKYQKGIIRSQSLCYFLTDDWERFGG